VIKRTLLKKLDMSLVKDIKVDYTEVRIQHEYTKKWQAWSLDHCRFERMNLVVERKYAKEGKSFKIHSRHKCTIPQQSLHKGCSKKMHKKCKLYQQIYFA